MAVVTTVASGGVKPSVINDTDRGTAQELLRITQSAVDALSLNLSGYRLTARDKNSVTVKAGNTEDVENLSTESRSSTASEILRRSTHASARLCAKPSLSPSEAARLVRVPVKVLREVPVPRDGMLSDRMPIPHDNFKHRVQLQIKPDQLVNADKLNSDELTSSRSNRKVKQDCKNMHSDALSLAVGSVKSFTKPSYSIVEASDRLKGSVISERNPVHPLMAILDNGCLTQPIHTIVAEERMSSGESHSTSMATSASPIEVLAEDKETRMALVSDLCYCLDCEIVLCNYVV